MEGKGQCKDLKRDIFEFHKLNNVDLYHKLQEGLLKYIATNYEERGSVVESIQMGAMMVILDPVDPDYPTYINRRQD